MLAWLFRVHANSAWRKTAYYLEADGSPKGFIIANEGAAVRPFVAIG